MIRNTFCPICGKESKNNKICKDCKEIEYTFKETKITICAGCKKFYDKKAWSKYTDLNKLIQDKIKSQLKIDEDIKKIIYDKEKLIIKGGINKKIPIQIITKNDLQMNLDFTFEVKTCKLCSKSNTKYFEGILQVRNYKPEHINYIKKYLKEHENGANDILEYKKIKVERLFNGMDLKIMFKKDMKNLGNKLVEKYGAYHKASAQHFSEDYLTSKVLYRLNTYIEFPNLEKNQIITIRNVKTNKEFTGKVTKISKTIKVKDLNSDKKITFQFNPDKPKYKIIKRDPLQNKIN